MAMKSIEDLKKIRDLAKSNLTMRSDQKQKYRVVVAMATQGIAAGARDILLCLVEEVANNNLPATVLQSGDIEECSLEPIVEVFDQNNNKTTYVLVDVAKAKEIASRHLKNDEIIKEYTIEQYQK